jgi:hypothetical protein
MIKKKKEVEVEGVVASIIAWRHSYSVALIDSQ